MIIDIIIDTTINAITITMTWTIIMLLLILMTWTIIDTICYYATMTWTIIMDYELCYY